MILVISRSVNVIKQVFIIILVRDNLKDFLITITLKQTITIEVYFKINTVS